MIIDTSAIVAVLLGEPSRAAVLDAILSSRLRSMSAGTRLELSIVVDRHRADPRLSRRLDTLLDALDVETLAVTPDQVEIGRAAYRDFGKGSGHPAGLNFRDLYAYALARSTNRPLLFVGDDFTHTDVVPALTAR